MAEPETLADSEESSGGIVAKLRAWAGGSRRRNLLIGGLLGAASLVTVVLWLTATEIAVAPEEATVDRALEALDAGDSERARSIIAQLQDTESLSAEDFGGALFVLGAVKIDDAERQWAPERSRTDYFVASQYLDESRALGFPEGRMAEGLYLLGKSLIESRQLEEGVAMLERALDEGAHGEGPAHLLLAEAHFYAPRPDYERAIAEIDLAVGDPDLPPDVRSAALLLKSEALSGLGRGDDALAAAQEAGGTADPARRALVEGKALTSKLEAARGPAAAALADQAIAALDRARRADNLATQITRESDYLRARVAELVSSRVADREDEREDALARYDSLRRGDGSSPAGVAAALAEASLLQEQGENEEAILAFRRALDAIVDPRAYRSGLLPLSEVRLRVRAAHERFLMSGDYAPALELAGRVGKVLGRTTQLELQARTLVEWGERERDMASGLGARGAKRVREGRRRLREAGLTYERLAEARYATREFTDDLWKAAEALREGQGYEEAIRVINRYLRNEPVDRNAQALLRLGEAHLARGEDEQAVAAFEECLEFHSDDAASFNARIECANAFVSLGRVEEAEALLRHNLTRTALTPESQEWRDSGFALGKLLADVGRYEDAILTLDDSIRRYEKPPYNEDPAIRAQVRSARYQVATAHREAAREPVERLRNAKTVSEAEQAREEADAHLDAALKRFREVQDEITTLPSRDDLDLVTQRNCFMLAGDVLFELGKYAEARQSYSNVSTLYQDDPYMLEAYVQIYHCWRRQNDRTKARGVVRQAQLHLERLPPEADFATSTNFDRNEWARLLTQLDRF